MPIKLQELQGVSVWVVTADGGLVPLNENLLGGSATAQIWQKDPTTGAHKLTPLRFIAVYDIPPTTIGTGSFTVDSRSSDVYSVLGLKTDWDTFGPTDKYAPTPIVGEVRASLTITAATYAAMCVATFELLGIFPGMPSGHNGLVLFSVPVGSTKFKNSGSPVSIKRTIALRVGRALDGVRARFWQTAYWSVWDTRITVSGRLSVEYTQEPV